MIMTTCQLMRVQKFRRNPKIDETALLVIVPASTVMGHGFSLQKDYQKSSKMTLLIPYKSIEIKSNFS